ncbi:hypothetical protein GOODEAATRI_010007 [Goodea atripinnis]|uniref:Uncharacterized protein n=1 Tax=Goodea atripinnis TaxID=208336 RepID=A0ABV0NBT2_9TELE
MDRGGWWLKGGRTEHQVIMLWLMVYEGVDSWSNVDQRDVDPAAVVVSVRSEHTEQQLEKNRERSRKDGHPLSECSFDSCPLLVRYLPGLRGTTDGGGVRLLQLTAAMLALSCHRRAAFRCPRTLQ